MNEHSADCERWYDDLAAHALQALDPAEERVLEAHLATCPSCAERLAWLQPAVDVLPVTVSQIDPPASLRMRLMETVEAESASPAVAPARPAPAKRRHLRLPVFGEFGMRPALAGLGLALVLAAGITGYTLNQDGPAGTASQTFEARSLAGSSLVAGTLVVDGDHGSLEVRGMAPTKNGEVYQAWVKESADEGGSIEPSSVFVVNDDGTGTVAIPHGLSNAAEVMVTREPKGGSEHPGGSTLISAEIR